METPAPREKSVKFERKNTFLKWGMVVVAFLFVVLLAMFLYRNVWVPSKIIPSPSPVATDPLWKSKSENNVKNFISFWAKAATATDPTTNAQEAKKLLTVEAQTKISNYVDPSNRPITDLLTELSTFVGTNPTEAYSVQSVEQVDTTTTEVTILLGAEPVKKIFTTKSENGAWLIDSVRSWGTN